MSDDERGLPTWFETIHSASDVELNKMPIEVILRLFNDGKIKIFVDRGLAIQATSSGAPTSPLTLILTLLFLTFIIGAIAVIFLYSWVYSLLLLVFAVISFRTSRTLIARDVRNQALKNPKLLNLLISKGCIWFEHPSGSSLSNTKIGTHIRGNTSSEQGTSTAAEFGERNTIPDRMAPHNIAEYKRAFSSRYGSSLNEAEKSSFSDGKVDLEKYFTLPEDHNGYHDILDVVVSKFTEPLQGLFPNEAENFVKIKCELVSYAAAYKAKLLAQEDIDNMIWNTVIRSIENRIITCLQHRPKLSEYETNSDGSRVFTSHPSVYVSHMEDLEGIVNSHSNILHTEIKDVLTIFSVKEDRLSQDIVRSIGEIFDRAVQFYSKTLIPHLNKKL